MKIPVLKLIIILFTTLIIILDNVAQAQAITHKLEWHGNDGYFAEVLFSYDEKTSPETLSEFGRGATDVLDSLTVTFFAPSGTPIATYNNVFKGVSEQDYFSFNFDTTTQKLFGLLDIGAYKVVPGNVFLKGNVEQNLALLQFDQLGAEVTIDSNPGSIIVSQSNNIAGSRE